MDNNKNVNAEQINNSIGKLKEDEAVNSVVKENDSADAYDNDVKTEINDQDNSTQEMAKQEDNIQNAEQQDVSNPAKAENKPKNDKLVATKISKGQTYKKLKRMMKTTKTMAICNSRVDMYKYLAKQFTKLKDYKNSAELAEKCKLKAKKTKKLIKKQIYESALQIKNSAGQPQDYKLAAEEFRKLPGYKDADELAVLCDLLAARLEKRMTIRRIGILSLLIIIFISLIIFISSSFGKYNAANMLMYVGKYDSAVKIYQSLGTYSDSAVKKSESLYKKGIMLTDTGSLTEALKAFSSVGEYKDSREKVADIERLIIKGSQIGDTVKLGKYEWLILDFKDNKVLLLKKKSMAGIPYNDVLTDVEWKDASLRKWLNSDFYADSFSAEEKKYIVLSNIVDTNPSTGIEEGEATKDYIFILSVEEAAKYINIMPVADYNIWLRTAGSSRNKAAFISSDKSIMENGYEVNSDKLAVRPVLWFSLE